MPLGAVEHTFTGATITSAAAYDSTKTILGKHIQQRTGPGVLDKYAGPMPVGLARPMEASTAIPVMYPHALKIRDDLHWVFLADNAAAAATRRIVLMEYTPSTSTFNWKGFITLTFPPTTAHTIRGLRAFRDLHTTGTVSASGTAVTGTGTTWQTNRLAVGARIGFGSTDPTLISTWYEITAVTSNTAITLGTSAGTVAGGTPYVIEELRFAVTTTNATTTNGGLFLAKGINYDTFTPTGVTIPAATTVDNIRAVYWLADAATVLNTVAGGCAVEAGGTLTSQMVYVLDGTTTPRVFKYDIRVALAGLSAGKSTSAFVLSTGTQAVTGTTSQANNGRIGTLGHGPGNGVQCLYFATTTRVYRAALTSITSGSTTWQADAMVEVPPGGTTTYAATSVMSSVEIADSIDRLIIMTTSASGQRHYVTRYNTVSDQFDHIWLLDTKQIDQSTADARAPAAATTLAQVLSVWAEDGIAYVCRNGILATNNHVYALPIATHWTYAGSQTPHTYLVTPKLATSDATKLGTVAIRSMQMAGQGNFGLQAEPFSIEARTTGIDDNTGGWVLLDDTGNISGLTASSHIQFRFAFRIFGPLAIPGRIYGLTVTYETSDALPSQLEWSFSDSALNDGTVGFRQRTTFASGVPNLEIEYRRSDNDALVLLQASTGSANGVFEYWTGSAWAAGLGSNTVGTRRRFRPTTGLPASTDLYTKLRTL